MKDKKTPAARPGHKATPSTRHALAASEGGSQETEKRRPRKKRQKRSRSLAEQRGLVDRHHVIFGTPDLTSREAVGWAPLAAVEAMGSVNKSIMTAVVDFNEMLCARIAAVNREWASFVGKRLAEDFELSRRFTACRNPGEVLNAYGSFLQMAFEQYQAEFTHMLELGQTFASQNGLLLKQQIRIAALREDALEKPSTDAVTQLKRNKS